MKEEKKTIEETKDNEIVELKDEDLKTITAGLRKSISKTDGSELLEKYQEHFKYILFRFPLYLTPS